MSEHVNMAAQKPDEQPARVQLSARLAARLAASQQPLHRERRAALLRARRSRRRLARRVGRADRVACRHRGHASARRGGYHDVGRDDRRAARRADAQRRAQCRRRGRHSRAALVAERRRARVRSEQRLRRAAHMLSASNLQYVRLFLMFSQTSIT